MELILTKPNAFLLSSSVVRPVPPEKVSLTAISIRKIFSLLRVGTVLLKREQKSIGFLLIRKRKTFKIHFSRKG
ncbi:hypothetical protein KH5_05160 [Urechidicola sp. KH5]